MSHSRSPSARSSRLCFLDLFTSLGNLADDAAPGVASAMQFLKDNADILIPVFAAMAATLTILLIPTLITLAATAWATAAGIIAAMLPILVRSLPSVPPWPSWLLHGVTTGAGFKTRWLRSGRSSRVSSPQRWCVDQRRDRHGHGCDTWRLATGLE